MIEPRIEFIYKLKYSAGGNTQQRQKVHVASSGGDRMKAGRPLVFSKQMNPAYCGPLSRPLRRYLVRVMAGGAGALWQRVRVHFESGETAGCAPFQYTKTRKPFCGTKKRKIKLVD